MGEIGKTRLDDTPVNGELGKGITSNWAYDEDVTLRALIEATLPWIIFINPLNTPKSNVNWTTISLSTTLIGAAAKTSTNALNNSIAWDVVLAAGTWEIEFIYVKGTLNGIFSVQFDSVEKGTIDTYDSSYTENVFSSITAINVPITKKIELKLKVTDTNPLSGSYYAEIQAIRLIRTA